MPSGGAGINHVAWRVRDIDGAVTILAERRARYVVVTRDVFRNLPTNIRITRPTWENLILKSIAF